MRDLRDLEIDAFLAQAESLGQLMAHPAWEAWTSLLRDLRASAMEQLAVEKDAGEIRYWQGAVGTLAEILDRPGRIAAAADDFRKAEEADTHTLRPELRSVIGLGVDQDGDV